MERNILKEFADKVENTKQEAMAQFIQTGSVAADTLMERCLTLIERIQKLKTLDHVKKPYLEKCWDVYMWHQNNKMPTKLDITSKPVTNIEDDMDINDSQEVMNNSADSYSGGHGYAHINWDYIGHAKGHKINPYWNKDLAKVKHPVRVLEGQEKLDAFEDYKARKRS
jgi:hypothetical protein|tara:strand:+ start:1966 stop:2469 length:504 start_codon:yes stop_codon:yes gene_type:complete